jgi:endonuclease I
MRHSHSFTWYRHQLYRFPNLYHSQPLPPQQHSCEHIIPKSFFRQRHHANDPMNLAPCDLKTNIRRSNFALGNIENMMEGGRPIYDSLDQYTGHLHTTQRIFYPSLECDRGLISRSILFMIEKYPYLYDDLPRILSPPDTEEILDGWRLYPSTTDFEDHRNSWLN